LTVLDGEVAVPCNPQAAIAGSKSHWRAWPVGSGRRKGRREPGPARRELMNPVRSGRKQR